MGFPKYPVIKFSSSAEGIYNRGDSTGQRSLEEENKTHGRLKYERFLRLDKDKAHIFDRYPFFTATIGQTDRLFDKKTGLNVNQS